MEQLSRVFDFVCKPWQPVQKKWRRLNTSGKLYFTANALLPAVLIGILTTSNLAPTTLLLFAVPVLALNSAGFVVWALSTLRNHPLSRHLPMIVIGIQALLIPLCISLAQKVVSEATELPGDAFELTTAILTVLLIPFAWATALFAIAASAMTIGIVGSAISQTILSLALPFFYSTGVAAQRLNAARQQSRAIGQHMLGFLVTTIFILFGATGLFASICQAEVVRIAAYALDFGTAHKYPGIDHSRPMKLLENNVVVYATRTGFEVDFDVESIQLPAPVSIR